MTEQAEPLSLAEALETARREADARRAEVEALDAERATALAEGRDADAERLTGALAPAKLAANLATAHATAIESVIAQVAREQAEREREAARLRAVEQARESVALHAATEREALDRASMLTAQASAGVRAVREALESALSAEVAAGDARRWKVNAMVAAGERPNGYSERLPDDVSGVIGANRLLSAIRNAPLADLP